MGVLLPTWMRVASSPCWINLTSLGRFCSPQTNYQLPKETLSVTSVIERGVDGDVCSTNPTIEERHYVSDKSRTIQHHLPAVLRDKSPGNHMMSPASGAAGPQEMFQIPHGSYWAVLKAVSGVPWGVGFPTAFLLMTFQSFFLNVSHGLLSLLLDYCFPWWIFGQSAEGFLALPAALRKGQSWGRGTKLYSLQSTFLWAVVKKIIKIAVFFLPTR